MEEMFSQIGETYFTLEEGKTCIEIQEVLAFPSSPFKVKSIAGSPIA
jgi:hypothetical protein